MLFTFPIPTGNVCVDMHFTGMLEWTERDIWTEKK